MTASLGPRPPWSPGRRRRLRSGAGLLLLTLPALAMAPTAPVFSARAATAAAAEERGTLPMLGLGLGRLQTPPAGMPATAAPSLTDGGPTGAAAVSAVLLQPIRLSGGFGSMPAQVLQAYQRATDRMATGNPGCRLRWSMLAGIGRVESNNGRDGAGITAQGTIWPPILGPVLDGSAGTAAIPDSDGGRLDGDSVWDRAVGPMQFLPSSWVATGVAGDPNNIVDAALATGRYLCAAGRDLADPEQLARAVFSYNHADTYVATVLAWITAYDNAGPGGVPMAPLTSASAPAVRPAVGPAPAPAPAPALAAPATALETPQPGPVEPTPPEPTPATPAPAPAPAPAPEPTPPPPADVAPAKPVAAIDFPGPHESAFGFTTLRTRVMDASGSRPTPLAGHPVTLTDDARIYPAITDADGVAEVTPAIPLTVGEHRVRASLGPADSFVGESVATFSVASVAGTVRGRALTFIDGRSGALQAAWDGTLGTLDLTMGDFDLVAAAVTALGISADNNSAVIAAVDSTGRPVVVRVTTGSDGATSVSVSSAGDVIVPATSVTAGHISIRRSE